MANIINNKIVKNMGTNTKNKRQVGRLCQRRKSTYV